MAQEMREEIARLRENVKQPNFVAYNLVDDINKKTYSIMKKDGVEAAANHMIKSANMDYAAMRSMYG